MTKPKKTRTDDGATAPKSLTAAGRRLSSKYRDPVLMARGGSGWQDAAWHFYNTVGEYAYSVNWVGNLLSRARLYATQDQGDGPERLPEDHPASRFVDALFGNEQGRSTALQQIGVHYTVAGEAYIVAVDGPHGEEWQIVAASRIKYKEKICHIDGIPRPGALVIRIWRPHPVDHGHATSPSRAALPILSEIERLTMHVAAQVDSRLASAGILLVPNQMAFAVAGENGTITGSADKFVQTLQEVAGRSIANREDASSLVPIVITADGEVLEHVKHLTFWSELDNQAIELRTEAIRRLALSMDMPPEILTGQGDASHWNAWAIDESSIKSHTEPLLARIADDIADGYLRPLMQDEGVAPDEVRSYGIGVDTTEMRLRPNRSAEAIELWDRGILSAREVLNETGFKNGVMSPEELRMWFTMKVASGQTQPEIVEAALRALGVELDVRPELDEPDSDRPEQHEQRPTPSLNDHPQTGPPATDDALLAGCEVMVFRALERAGNRLRNKSQGKLPGIAAAEHYRHVKMDSQTINYALEDAWSAVNAFAPRWGVDAQRLEQCLDAYTRAIMLEKKPHDPAMMASFIGLMRETAK